MYAATIFGYTAISRYKPVYSVASNARSYAFVTLRQLNAFYLSRICLKTIPLDMLGMMTATSFEQA